LSKIALLSTGNKNQEYNGYPFAWVFAYDNVPGGEVSTFWEVSRGFSKWNSILEVSNWMGTVHNFGQYLWSKIVKIRRLRRF